MADTKRHPWSGTKLRERERERERGDKRDKMRVSEFSKEMRVWL